ncbi:hypothetical protein CEXT_209681 [Caerostris extrusa]|uniref:Uncharacterized protein n=1 Tax=Caerostris extrusa TaxID=172846 RepID=A0AAV4PFX7_CAEEX|nr:hypothetical protein CEXT_209681 [Caerostris extrusa]
MAVTALHSRYTTSEDFLLQPVSIQRLDAAGATGLPELTGFQCWMHIYGRGRLKNHWQRKQPLAGFTVVNQ